MLKSVVCLAEKGYGKVILKCEVISTLCSINPDSIELERTS